MSTDALKPVGKWGSREVSVLQEADALINGSRNGDYGPPRQDYLCAVHMYRAWSVHKYPDGARIESPEDGLMFMVFVKLSREAHKHKRDNLVDAAGYLGCYAKCTGEDQ